MRPLRIGTRGSILARWQAEFVRKQLFQITGVEAEIIIIRTSGDKMQQAALTEIGGLAAGIVVFIVSFRKISS